MRLVAGARLQFDAEATARHAEGLHLRLHRLGQAAGSLPAQGAQFLGLLPVVTFIGGQFLAEALDRLVVGVQAFQFLQQALLQLGQFEGLHPVFARQAIDGVQALLQQLLALRVGIEVIDEAVQFADRLLDLDLRAGQQVGGFAQCRLVAEAAQAVEAGGQCRQHVAGIALAAQVEHLAAGAEQLLGIAQGLVLLLQLFQLVVAQGQVLQLFQLVAEQLMTSALFVAAGRQALQFLARLAPALRGQLHLARQFLAAGILVEQAAVGVGFEQRLVLVLAVDVDQQFAEGLEIAQRAGGAVDIAARAPFAGDDPAQNARAVVVQVAFGQPGAGFGDVLQVEAGEDVRLVRAGADHAAVGAVAQGQAEGVEHDRLAGAGLAGDHRHAALQFEVQMFDDGVVVNGQVHQHGERSQKFVLGIYTVFCFVRAITLETLCAAPI